MGSMSVCLVHQRAVFDCRVKVELGKRIGHEENAKVRYGISVSLCWLC